MSDCKLSFQLSLDDAEAPADGRRLSGCKDRWKVGGNEMLPFKDEYTGKRPRGGHCVYVCVPVFGCVCMCSPVTLIRLSSMPHKASSLPHLNAINLTSVFVPALMQTFVCKSVCVFHIPATY